MKNMAMEADAARMSTYGIANRPNKKESAVK